MAEQAESVRAPAPAKAAEPARRVEPGESHEALEARPEIEAKLGYRAMLNGRPALVAQRKVAAGLAARAPGPQPVQPPARPNCTGLPDRLKSGVEALSGVTLDGVKVQYNSSKPAELNAHAYAQGTDIHLAPGQERHLPHEAWHVVQQAQGRVRPTMQLKNGVAVNADEGLEHEADVMGAKALGAGAAAESGKARGGGADAGGEAVVQRASVEEMQGAVGEFARLRQEIRAALAAEWTVQEMGVALLRDVQELKALAEYVAADKDHEIYKGAYGGIYDYVDGLFDKIAGAGLGKEQREGLYDEMREILALLRAATEWAHTGITDFEERRQQDPVKYVLSLARTEVEPDALRTVLAQAAYMSGDMFGVAAALRLDPNLGVVIFYDHLMNKDREIERSLLDFYRNKAGDDHPRVSLIPVTDSAAAYKSAIAGDFSDRRLFPLGTPRIVSGVGHCAAIGTATRIVAEAYQTSPGGARAQLEQEWLPEGAKEGTARGSAEGPTIAEWVEAKGLRKGPSYAFIWFRRSGARGGAHKELDTSLTATEQIIETCQKGEAADHFVLIGDREPKLATMRGAIDLMEFWQEPGSPFHGAGRKMQLALFSYLVAAGFKIMNIGMRSGALEGPALLGVKTVFLEEKLNLQEGRMEQWQGAVPGFSRVELEHVPTAEGKVELARLVDLTIRTNRRNFDDAVDELVRAYGGFDFDKAIKRAASAGIDPGRGLYDPNPVEDVLRDLIESIEKAGKGRIDALFRANKRQMLALMRKAIRAYQEWGKGEVKRELGARYEGPDEGLSPTDREKMWGAVATNVGGWEAPKKGKGGKGKSRK